MNDIQVIITDYYDMLNLHKALLEAKFHEEPDNEYVSGSPIIARICNDLVNKVAEYEIRKNGKENWTEWRKLKNQNFYKERAVRNIVKFSEWKKSSYIQKVNIIYNYLTPFTYTEGEMSILIKEIDQYF